MVLHRHELDIWQPAQHNGTFRGNQLAFITATAALQYYWSNNSFTDEVKSKQDYLKKFIKSEIQSLHPKLLVRGIGFIWGIDFSKFDDKDLINNISKQCFEAGLLIETTGRNSQVIKILPPLTIENRYLVDGCNILKKAIELTLLLK